MRDTANIAQQLTLQLRGSVGRKVHINRIGEPAKTRLDRRRDVAISAAGGEQPNGIVAILAPPFDPSAARPTGDEA